MGMKPEAAQATQTSVIEKKRDAFPVVEMLDWSKPPIWVTHAR